LISLGRLQNVKAKPFGSAILGERAYSLTLA
jgi:hypothetical protein